MIRRAALGLALAIAAGGGCRGDRTEVSPRRATLEALIDNVFMPMLEAFEHESERLAAQTAAFCAEPSADALAATRASWNGARASWERAELLSFGPQTLPPWRLASNIDFWPTRPASIDEVLKGDAPLGAEGALERMGAAVRGFGALEYLLFAEADDAAALSAFEANPRRCEYLVALGADLHARASELRRVWADEFVPELLVEGGSERYASVNEAFGAVVNSLAFTVEVVRDEKLGKPLGIRTGGDPQPELLPSRFADRATEDARDNLLGIANVFSGRFGDAHARGIADLLRERGEGKDAEFAVKIDDARRALAAIPAPLAQSLVDEREKVEAARKALEQLLLFLQVDLTQSLSVTVTFGGADGD